MWRGRWHASASAALGQRGTSAKSQQLADPYAGSRVPTIHKNIAKHTKKQVSLVSGYSGRKKLFTGYIQQISHKTATILLLKRNMYIRMS